MRFLTSTAPAVLALMLAAPAAHADMMVGNQTITDADRAAVSEHCKMLLAGAEPATPANSGNVENAKTEKIEAGQTAADATPPAATTQGNEGNPDQALDAVREAPANMDTNPPATDANTGNPNNDSVSNVNLQEISLADCQTAGVMDW